MNVYIIFFTLQQIFCGTIIPVLLTPPSSPTVNMVLIKTIIDSKVHFTTTSTHKKKTNGESNLFKPFS